MAARSSSALPDRHRDAIRTAMLVKRLQGFALSEPDPQTNKPIQMSRDQMTAAIALLKKTMPDLMATTLEAAPGTAMGFVLYGQPEAKDADEWQAQNPPPA